MTDRSFRKIIDTARDLIAQQKYREGYKTLELAVEFPGDLVEGETDLAEALTVFSDIARGLKEEKLAESAAQLTHKLNDPAALYNFAYDLYESSLHSFAATILARADRIMPGAEKIVTELVTNLENIGKNSEAVAILQRYGQLQKTSYFCNYLLAFNSIASGNLEQGREAYKLLQSKKEAADGDFAHLTTRVELFLKRAERVKAAGGLGESDLRGWQYVINTNILLHESPYGRNEGMNGRYAFIQDNESLMRRGIELLRTALEVLHIEPERVLYPAEMRSETLARAAAGILGLDTVALSKANEGLPGLIVVYDLSILPKEEFQMLEPKRDGQFIWSHMNCWTVEDSFSPEFSTLLYQYNISPWEEQLVAASGSDGVNRQVRFAGSMTENVMRITEADFGKETEDFTADRDRLQTLLKNLSTVFEKDQLPLGTLFATETPRRPRKWRGTPVGGNYFKP